jgi:hypothetical protein
MRIRRLGAGLWLAAFVAVPAAGLSEQHKDGAPLSAIDWLSDSVATPVSLPSDIPGLPSDISANASHSPVTTMPLDGALPDAVGLMSPAEANLPAGLWGASPAIDIARRLTAEPLEMLPEMQALLRRVLLARLDPPVDADTDASLFLARVDRLLQLGLLTEAQTLLAEAPTNNADIFRRIFDVALLTGEETAACGSMRQSPEFSPTYSARIFCLARMGDWQAAALTLESANAIGILTPEQDHLMARFLDPELFEGQPPPRAPMRPSPLTYRLYEAIGEPEKTSGLPIAFAHADMRSTSGWKARLEAAERLAETGAISSEELFDLYRQNRPSASGGIWERARAIQTLDAALMSGDTDKVGDALPTAWDQMESARLEYPFAEAYGARLNRIALPDDAQPLAFRIGLLSPEFKSVAEAHRPSDPYERFLVSLARGMPGYSGSSRPLTRAVQEGFAGTELPVRYRNLVESDRRGEALLLAVQQFSEGAFGDYDQIADALALFRYLGLEDTARRAALELLILERRG